MKGAISFKQKQVVSALRFLQLHAMYLHFSFKHLGINIATCWCHE